MTDQNETLHRDRRSTSGLFSDAVNHLTTLARKEAQLARAEIGESVDRAVGGVVGLAVAAVLGVGAINLLAAFVVAALVEWGLEEHWALLIVGVGLALVAWILFSQAKSALSAANFTPDRTMKNIRRDAQTVKENSNVH